MGLIVPQIIEIRIAANAKKHYKSKGYNNNGKELKQGDIISVNVVDLHPGSHTMVKCTCDICGKETEIQYRDVLKNVESNRLIVCKDPICIKRKNEDTCIKKYNVKYSLQSKEVRDKGMQTLKEKYGEDITNAFQATAVKEQIKQTNLKNWGVEYVTQNKEIRNKMKETNRKRYGVDHPIQNKEIQDKIKETCREHYGVDNPSQSQEIKDKKTATCREHFGVDNPFQSKKIQDKAIQTLKEKYGESIINISQVKEIRDKIIKTNIKRYGVDCASKSNVVKNKIKITNLKRYGCTCSLQSEESKKKSKETMMKNYGVEHALQNKELLNKVYSTNLERYGNKNYFASNDFKNKVRDMWSFNGNDGPCSRQQKYIANLVNGKINAVIAEYWADIVLENEKIDLEYDGGGHNLNVIRKQCTQEEFDLKEKDREEKIYKKGYKIIRIISKKDKLPSDEVILNLIDGFKNSNFKVIRIDFEEGTIDRDYKEKWYCNFGKLRKITKKDLEKFNNTSETSEN